MVVKSINKTRVLLYIRVSSHEQAVEGYSIGEQTERLTKYADAMGWTVVKTYTDPGYTGADTHRPGLRELIRSVEAGHADKVVVYKLDRLSRSQKDTLYLIEDVFLENNTDFVSMSENFDTSTAFGRAIIGILAVFAQLERETIKERMTMGREARAKNGYYTGGRRTLTGYDYIDGLLKVNDYEAMLIKQIFEMFNGGMPLKTIANTLNDRGLYHRATEWNDTTIRRLLDNRHYIGEVKFGGKWYPGRQNPIIDIETFSKAQKILKVRADSYVGSNKHSVPLTGFIECGVCGAKFHRQAWKKRKDGTREAFYMCYSRSKKVKKMIVDPNCQNRYYKTEELEEIVYNEIRKLGTDPDYLDKIREEITQEREADESIQVIKKEIDSLTYQISKFMDLYSINRLTLQEVDDKITPLSEKRDKLETDLRILTKPKDGALSPEEVEELVDSFGDILDRGDLEEIRLTLTTLIKKIVITGDEVKIFWNFA